MLRPLLLALLLAGPAPADTAYPLSQREGFTPYQSRHGEPLRLEYREAARRWPDARSCLHPDQRHQPQPDITALDVTAFRSTLDVEACLFRILDALGTPRTARRWMQALGLHDIRSTRIRRPGGPRLQLCGTNATSTTGRVIVPATNTVGTVALYLYGGEIFCSEWTPDGLLLATSYAVDGLQGYPADPPPARTLTRQPYLVILPR